MISIREVMTDPQLFGDQFSGESWFAWRTLLAGFYGLELNDQELETWHAITGQDSVSSASNELWMVIGRRGGKTQTAALLAVFEAAFNNHESKLSPGEVATVMLLAADRKQARSAFRYVVGLMRSNPMLERMIVREDSESIELTNRTVIEVSTASFRSVRGYTVGAVVADEIAFWRSDESANPDSEIINALRPAMATLGGKLIALSSPYARRGALWDHYSKHYGKPGDILVAQAASRVMNPTLPGHLVKQALERDPAAAGAEYLAQFRSDVETFVQVEAITACTANGRLELPPITGVRYSAFVDPSGGSKDAFTLAIAHLEGDTIVVDAIRAIKPPFSPALVVDEFAQLLKSYRINEVTGDRYGGEFPRELFKKAGISYKLSDRSKSDLYRDLLPLLNSGRVELLDNKQLHAELLGLERRTARGGRDSIDHAPGQHDDLVNAMAGAVLKANQPKQSFFIARAGGDSTDMVQHFAFSEPPFDMALMNR